MLWPHLQKGLSNMKHLTAQSLGKLQDGVEEGLSQAEDDMKNAKSELAEVVHRILEVRPAGTVEVLTRLDASIQAWWDQLGGTSF